LGAGLGRRNSKERTSTALGMLQCSTPLPGLHVVDDSKPKNKVPAESNIDLSSHVRVSAGKLRLCSDAYYIYEDQQETKK
jgi:hypothetical protein